VVLADEPERFLIAAFSRHSYITLDREMRGTGRLARRGAGIITVDFVVVAVIRVPLVFAPDVVVGEIVHGIFHLAAVCPAKLLPQPGRAGGTYLHALSAGDA